MSLDFTRVTYDGDIENFSEDQLRELAREFQNAQNANQTEFEEVADAWDTEVQEFQQVRENLVSEITDAEAFSKVPLTEDQLEDADFSELQEWRDFIGDGSTGEGSDDEENDGEPEDFGTRSPEQEGKGRDFDNEIEDRLEEISGVNAE